MNGVVCECSYEKVKEIILEEVASGCNKFAIFPYGKYGNMAKEILDQMKEIHYIIIDEKLANEDENIYRLSILREQEYRNYTVLLCSNKYLICSELRGMLSRYAIWNRIIDVCMQDSLFGMLQFKEARLATLESVAREIKSRNIPGNVAEAGVFRGDFSKYINIFFPEKKLYLIDTFDGFDERDTQVDLKESYISGVQDWSGTEIQMVLDKMRYKNNCIIKKGYFPDSMKEIDDCFCFVSLDMDLYQPTYNGLCYFYPRLNTGGYIFIHDCRNIGYLGARQAVIEFCRERKIGYVPLSDFWGTAVITK